MALSTPAQAAEAFTEIGLPGCGVIKPRNGNHGANVTVGVPTSATDAIDAYQRASVTRPGSDR